MAIIVLKHSSTSGVIGKTLLPASVLGGRIDLKLVSQAFLIDHVLKHGLGHGRAADIAVTNKKHFYHIYDLPRKTLKHLILLGFQAMHSIKRMFHIVPYRGLFCPSLGVKLGVKIRVLHPRVFQVGKTYITPSFDTSAATSS